MKKVWINTFQIHDNQIDLGFALYLPILGLEWPGVRIQPYQKAGEHGAVVPNQFYDGRTINLTGRISGDTISQYVLNRRSLASALRIVEDVSNIATPLTLKIQTMDDLFLECLCYVIQPPVFTEKSPNYATFQVQLYAPDYNLYDISVQALQITNPAGGGVTYPVIYPVTYGSAAGGRLIITNQGNSDTFPVIYFYGPLNFPLIKNETTGYSFLVNYALQSGDVLVVDMANKTMVLNSITNAMQYFDYNNTWFSLAPQNNIISLTSNFSADMGYAIVNFQNAYIGI